MDNLYFLDKESTALLLIDCQDKLFPKIARKDELLRKIIILLRGFQVLKLPILITEQYPQGIGKTINEIRECCKDQFKPYSKTAFSCFLEPPIRKQLLKMPQTHWVLSGIETHVCVLQTAKDLLSAGKKVIIISDATSSRNPTDFSVAIEELRQCGARITTVEACLFELLRDAQAKEFKDISNLIK
jgi:nicotinamidase-related amidase